jgi:hypothetical protein
MVISQVGFDLNTAPGAVGAEAITDAIVTNTPIFIRTSTASSSSSPRSLVLNNIRLTNVPIAVGVNGGDIVLEGGTTTIGTWGQGNVYSSTSGTATFTQGSITAVNTPSSLLASTGNIFGRSHPQYETYAVSQFVSALIVVSYLHRIRLFSALYRFPVSDIKPTQAFEGSTTKFQNC